MLKRILCKHLQLKETTDPTIYRGQSKHGALVLKTYECLKCGKKVKKS